jgi:hypothetical protein
VTAAELEQAIPTCTAATCGRPQAAAALLCDVDVRRLGDMLAQIGSEYELLSATPSMQGREVGSIGGTTLTSQRSPGNTHVMALRSRARGTGRIGWEDADPWGMDDTPSVYDTLTTYAEMVREGRKLEPPRMDVAHVRTARPLGPVCDPAGPRCGHHTCEVWTFRASVFAPLTVASERALLVERQNFRWLLLQVWAGEFFDEIRGLYALLLRANGHAAPARRIHRLQAPCSCCGVRAVTHRPGAGHVSCENCGASSPVPEMDDRMSA